MRTRSGLWIASYLRQGRLVPQRGRGLRAGAVRLAPGDVMDWHSTLAREELLIVLRGWVSVEVQDSRARRHRSRLTAGECAWLPPQTRHRVLNRSLAEAAYIYVTAPVSRVRKNSWVTRDR
ncbi:MAG: cupin domain-containing protein [Candidatus Omnitrophota bacterium]|nr:cupin domain-containing protein [Candidatus Omnitrophota bacterium]